MTGRRFHRTTEAIPRRPWKAKSPFASRPIQIGIKRVREECARGTTRASSIHFHRAVPRSSSHTGPRKMAFFGLDNALLRVRGFRGSVAGREVCNSRSSSVLNLGPPKKGPKSQVKYPKESIFGPFSLHTNRLLWDILLDFWGHFSGEGGVPRNYGIFRTLKCTFGVSGLCSKSGQVPPQMELQRFWGCMDRAPL